MVALEKTADDVDSLVGLATALEDLTFGPALDDLAEERHRLVRALRSYLIPRVENPMMPLTVVFVGPTGSGKSTLVNSLAGRTLTETGPVRPTTMGPVALVATDAVSEDMAIAGIDVVAVGGNAPILDSMILVDTPDIDSTETSHRAMTEMLVDEADVVVFVTSALRYADEAPWQVLRRAVSRGAEVVNVLNRLTPANTGAMVDFAARLTTEGLDHNLLTVSEHHIDPDQQRVPSLAVRALSRHLVKVAIDRREVGNSVTQRVKDNISVRATELADSLSAAADRLQSIEAELDIALASRLKTLTWPTDVGVTFPANPRKRAIRRWKKTAETAVTDTHLDLLVASVQSDLLLWALGSDFGPVPRSEVREAVSAVSDVTAETVLDWKRGLIALVETTPPETWAEMARADLVARVEIVYRYLGYHLAELAEIQLAHTDYGRLRKAIAALALVDA